MAKGIPNVSSDNSEVTQLERYLHEIEAYAPLTDEQEADLSKRILMGDKEAVDELVKANLKFVVSIARQYKRTTVNMLDLINEGNIALLHAAEKYDAAQGKRFTQYAVWTIREAMRAFLRSNGIIAASKDIDNIPVGKDPTEDLLGAFDSRQALDEAIETLPIREQQVIKSSFGVGQTQLTMQEIANRYNISRARVKAIRKHALQRLAKQRNKIKE